LVELSLGGFLQPLPLSEGRSPVMSASRGFFFSRENEEFFSRENEEADADETSLSSPGNQAIDRPSLAADHAVPANVDSA
jgi:hypothetical protein